MSLFYKLRKLHLVHPLLHSFGKRQIQTLSWKVGDTATVTKKITFEEVQRFAELSGDRNPVHVDKEFITRDSKFENCIVHGAYLNSLVSAVIGTQLPGPGTLVVKQELNFPSPCYIDEEVNITVKLAAIRKILTVDFTCVTSSGKVVLWGNCRLTRHSSKKV